MMPFNKTNPLSDFPYFNNKDLILKPQIPVDYESLAGDNKFVKNILTNFTFINEREGVQSTQEFISGTFASKLQLESNPDDEKKYYQQCLRSLDWSFSETISRDRKLLPLYAGSIEEMVHYIREAINLGVTYADTMRDRLPLDTIPFKYAKQHGFNINDLSKDDEIRVSFQALFLFLLRPFIPLKYETTEIFLEKYPDLVDRSPVEIERLKNTSNWMDLSFYTIQPRNNKTFVLNLIPRIVEGRNARYITGSGQTKPTADRVNLFRVEGNCEKIKRPPRRKKEELPTSLSNDRQEEMEPRKSVFGSTLPPETNNNNPNLMQFPMLYNAFFTPGMIPYQQLAAYNNAMLKKKKESSSGLNFSNSNGSNSGPVLSMFQMPSANDEANLAKHGMMLSDGLHYSALSGESNGENKPLLPSLLDNNDLMKSASSNSQKEKKNNNESNNNNKNAKINPLLAGLPSYSPAMLSPSSSAMANNRMPQMPWFSPWGYYPMVDPSMGNHPDASSQGLPSSANVDPSNINMTLNSLYSNPYAGQIHPALLRNNLASMNANSFNNIIPFTASNPSNNNQSLGAKQESESKANHNNEPVAVAKANKKRKTPSESAQPTAVAPVAPKKTMEPPAKKQMNAVSSQSLNNLVYKTQQPMLRGHTSTSSEGLDLLLAAVGSVENGFELP